jgi:hypothetical protein
MSQTNDYPITQPSREFQAQLTAILKLPHSPALEKHLRDCATCSTLQAMCDEAQQMLREIRYMAHREGCVLCHGPVMCAEGEAIWHG